MSDDEPIFAEALNLPPGERPAFLDRACGGDAARRDRLEGLLAAHETLDPVLNPPQAVQQERALELSGDVIGRYKLLQKIGEGGCGVVWLAEQSEPVRRRVALKVIKLGMDTRAVVARFEAERQALALMDHPGIARVLDAGATKSGRPFFVMELVRGVPITRYCDEHALNPGERLELFIKVCHAVQHAHQKGIIHRDLKPSNILVMLSDNVATPKVIDFGIAKATQGRLTESTVFTAFDQFIGTPAYMSPEQAEMSSLDIDTRSDVYSLGVLLYELLTARTPFETRSLQNAGVDEIRRIIRESNPPRPSRRLNTLNDGDRSTIARCRGTAPAQLQSLLSGDLDWIVMRCLEKDRARRYDTPNALADDIRRHLDNQPVLARPPGRGYLLMKFIRRNRLAVGAGLAIGAAIVAGVVVSTTLAIRARRLARDADDRAREARMASYTAEMNLAQSALNSGNLVQAVRLLDKYIPKPGEKDIRGFEWRYLSQTARLGQSDALGSYGGGRGGLAISPDGALFAATIDRTIEVRALPSGRVLRTLTAPRAAGVLKFSPDGKWLVCGFRQGSVGSPTSPQVGPELRRWETQGWTELPTYEGIGTPFEFGLAGTVIAGIDAAGKLAVWNAATGARSRDLGFTESSGNRLSALAASADGRLLFAGGNADFGIREWDLGRMVELDRLRLPFSTATNALAVSADGVVAAAHPNGAVTLWSVDTRLRIATYEEHNGPATGVAFSPDGATLASSGSDQRIVLYDRAGRNAPVRLSGHAGEQVAIGFPAGSRSLISASNSDDSVRRWTVIAAEEDANILPARYAFSFSEGSESIVCWDAASGFVAFDLATHSRQPLPYRLPADFDPSQLAAARISVAAGKFAYIRSGEVVVCELATGAEATVLKPVAGRFSVIAFSPDGQLLAAAGPKAGTWVWPVANWSGHALAGATENAGNGLMFSMDSSLLASDEGNRLLVYHPSSTVKPIEFGGSPSAGAIAISPDGSKLAFCVSHAGSSTIQIYDLLNPAKPPAVLTGHFAAIRSIAFSPDGRTLASCGDDFLVKLWSMDNFLEILTLPSRRTGSRLIAFSRDGQWLADDASDDTVQLWHAPLAFTR